MKLRGWLRAVSVSGLALMASAVVVTASAAPTAHHAPAKAKEGDKEKAKETKKEGLPFPAPKGLRFGFTPDELSDFYAKVWDQEFLALFKKADPSQHEALEYELQDRKALLKRNLIGFGKLPTGIDQSPLKGEYSYLNGESMTRFTQKSGTRRNFFFFKSVGLWKIYDEYKLRAGGPLGGTFDEAVATLEKKFGKKPKLQKADFEKGRAFDTAEWSDNRIIIRAVNRDYQKIVGLVYVNKETEADLDKLRSHKAAAEPIDAAVKAATTKPPPEKPGPKKAPEQEQE